MGTVKYDLDLKVTLEDFKNSNYQSIIKKAQKKSFTNYWDVLASEANKQIDKGNDKTGKVLWLLSNICSFKINPKNTHNIFSSYAIWEDKRSAIPEDFTSDDIEFFKEVVSECLDFRLKARIADVLWYLKKEFPYVKIAIENYLKFPLNKDTLHTDTKNSFQRAIKLCISTKQKDFLKKIQIKLIQEFKHTKVEDNYYPIELNKLLLISVIDIDSNIEIIQKLEEFANEANKEHNWIKARDYYQSCKSWFEIKKDINNINRIIINIADTFIKEAKSRSDSQMVSSKLYDNAIQSYRSIDNIYREDLDIKNKIKNTYTLMTNSNKLVKSELHEIKTKGVDISEWITSSVSRIQNKDFENALITFANITKTPRYNNIKKGAIKRLDSSIFGRLFGTTHYSSDGRVIAKTSGGLDGNESNEQQLKNQMQQDYGLEVELIIHGGVFPAFTQFNLEHTISKEYLITLCSNSSVVPRERAIIWAEGLYFGFETNFLVSTHLLIPQLEHLIRTLLKQENIQTTVLEATGIEIEKGLSTLIKEEKLKEILSEDLIFDLKSLLTEALGYNMRNNVAHGLSETDIFISNHAMYLWWFCLKMVVNHSHIIRKEEL